MNFNEAREQANVNHRAQRLFEDGYTAEIIPLSSNPKPVRVTSPQGAEYIVDPLLYTCNCPYFVKKNEGKKFGEEMTPCKHYLGFAKLLEAQEADACGMDLLTYRKWAAENGDH